MTCSSDLPLVPWNRAPISRRARVVVRQDLKSGVEHQGSVRSVRGVARKAVPLGESARRHYRARPSNILGGTMLLDKRIR